MSNNKQTEMFENPTTITGLAITKARQSGSELIMELKGVTNATDLSSIPKDAWMRGVAEWLATLAEGERMVAIAFLDEGLRVYHEGSYLSHQVGKAA